MVKVVHPARAMKHEEVPQLPDGVVGRPDMPRIEQVWAYLAVDKDGDEGICGFKNGDNWMPMVCADRVRVDLLRPVAEQLTKTTGLRIVLAKFSTRTDEESFE